MNVVPGVSEGGQPVKNIRLSKMTVDILRVATKIVSSKKPVLEDLKSLKVFLDSLLIPELQEYSMNSIQIISIQYIIPVESGFFEFMSAHLLDAGLERTRRILILSTKNAVSELNIEDKQKVLGMLEPVLIKLLVDASMGLEKEIRGLLLELGVYNLPYNSLEELYMTDIIKGKTPEFYRMLILRDHYDKVPRLRAALMVLHMESNDSTRSIIRDELPHIR